MLSNHLYEHELPKATGKSESHMTSFTLSLHFLRLNLTRTADPGCNSRGSARARRPPCRGVPWFLCCTAFVIRPSKDYLQIQAVHIRNDPRLQIARLANF